LSWVTEVRRFFVFFGIDWGLSIVGCWLAILSDSKGEAGFRIRYSLVSSIVSTLYLRAWCCSWIRRPWCL